MRSDRETSDHSMDRSGISQPLPPKAGKGRAERSDGPGGGQPRVVNSGIVFELRASPHPGLCFARPTSPKSSAWGEVVCEPPAAILTEYSPEHVQSRLVMLDVRWYHSPHDNYDKNQSSHPKHVHQRCRSIGGFAKPKTTRAAGQPIADDHGRSAGTRVGRTGRCLHHG